MPRLYIALLGDLRVTLDEQPVDAFQTDKVRALLAYLVVESDRAHRRETLGALLWPEQPEKDTRNNLRVTLSRLRKALPAPPGAASFLLQPNQKSVQFNTASEHLLDIAAFAKLVARSKAHNHRRLVGCRLCMRRLAQAVALYNGDFLTGFSLPDSAPFEEWALLQREHYRRDALWALRQLSAHYERRGEYEATETYAHRQVELDPLDEGAQRQLLRALAGCGQRNAALAQYRRVVKLLAAELGVAPEAKTTALYEVIRAGEWTASTATPRHNLPVQATPFIGREQEIGELSEQLLDPDTRLLTLVGEGGIGKTRLALAAAAQVQDSFPDGVWFVSLAGAAADDGLYNALPIAIAGALDITFSGKDTPKAQVLAYLRKKETLLVLDNFEHLLAGADFVWELQQYATRTAVLVTSRERLKLQAEQVVRLSGLPVPETAADPAAATYSSVQLFAECARRIGARLTLDASTLAEVVPLCALVQGNPLGIELTAAWSNQYTPAEIMAALRADLAAVPAMLRDVPERHSSLRAVFEHSWRLLTPDEQAALAQASVFRGGFSRAAALAVTQAGRSDLASLVEKSLVRQTDPGRYELHELLRHFAAEKLEGPMSQTSEVSEDFRFLVDPHERHSRYYLEIVSEQAKELRGRKPQKAAAALRGDLDNIRAAWRRAIEQTRIPALAGSQRGLAELHHLSGLFEEGQMAMELAASRLQQRLQTAAQPDDEAQRVLAHLFAEQARFLNELARYAQAISTAQQAIALANEVRDVCTEAAGYQQWGLTLLLQGDYEGARKHLEQARVRALEAQEASANGTPDPEQVLDLPFQVEADSLRSLGFVSMLQGDYGGAASYCEQALRIWRELDDRRGEGNELIWIGAFAMFQGDYDRSMVSLNQALNIGRAAGDRWCEGHALMWLAATDVFVGNYAGASTNVNQALLISRESGDRYCESLSLAGLGLLCHRRGDNAAAREYSQQAAHIHRSLGEPVALGYSQVFLGHALAGLGQLEDAAATYQSALDLQRLSGQLHLTVEPLAGLARVFMAQDDLPQARARVEEILNYLETKPSLDGTFEPFRVYLSCYHVLRANDDPRAQDLLTTAHRLLQEQAANIPDENTRRSFLDNVAAHREIVAAWKASVHSLAHN